MMQQQSAAIHEEAHAIHAQQINHQQHQIEANSSPSPSCKRRPIIQPTSSNCNGPVQQHEELINSNQFVVQRSAKCN
ncbi:hypothetical protein Dimus_036493 [Dionaea muscipula]